MQAKESSSKKDSANLREFILFFLPPHREKKPNAETAHLQIARANSQTKICKRVVLPNATIITIHIQYVLNRMTHWNTVQY